MLESTRRIMSSEGSQLSVANDTATQASTKRSGSSQDIDNKPSCKIPRLQESPTNCDSKCDNDGHFSKRYGFYFSKVKSINPMFDDPSSDQFVPSIGIRDILNENDGHLIKSAQFSYVFDLAWLVEQYPLCWRKFPLHVVFGIKNEDDLQSMEKQCGPFPQVELCPVKLTDKFGTHHTKMMLLHFEEGLRVVIHTANLYAFEWENFTQGIWISPICPPLTANDVDDCKTGFKQDLIQYLSYYSQDDSHFKQWSDLLKIHNFSSVNVALIASVPGKHLSSNRSSFGHLKLRKILSANSNGMESEESLARSKVICQFSSIGTLGPTKASWLESQFLSSLSSSGSRPHLTKANLKLIYPSLECIRNFYSGYDAAIAFPYTSRVNNRQPYLVRMMNRWSADRVGRTRAAPHIKTYCRVTAENRLCWFLLTSANLSKAAWGQLENGGSSLFIRSFELGVLFMPRFLGIDQPILSSEFLLPFDLELKPYQSGRDKPWLVDKCYAEHDLFGRTYQLGAICRDI